MVSGNSDNGTGGDSALAKKNPQRGGETRANSGGHCRPLLRYISYLQTRTPTCFTQWHSKRCPYHSEPPPPTPPKTRRTLSTAPFCASSTASFLRMALSSNSLLLPHPVVSVRLRGGTRTEGEGGREDRHLIERQQNFLQLRNDFALQGRQRATPPIDGSHTHACNQPLNKIARYQSIYLFSSPPLKPVPIQHPARIPDIQAQSRQDLPFAIELHYFARLRRLHYRRRFVRHRRFVCPCPCPRHCRRCRFRCRRPRNDCLAHSGRTRTRRSRPIIHFDRGRSS